MALRYVALVVLLLVAGCGIGAPPRAERPTRLYLAGDRELWVVDVAHQRVRHLSRPTLGAGDAPHRILARGRRLVMGPAFGDSAYYLPSQHRDRVWVVDVGGRDLVRAVREVTVDGVTTEPASVPPPRRWPLAAVDDGLLLSSRAGLELWDPHSDRVVRTLPVDPGTLGPTSGDTVVTCPEPGCSALQLTDARTGASRVVDAPPGGYTFEPWGAAFSPDGTLLGVPVRVVADGPRHLALVDVASGRVALVPASSVSPGYTLVAWSADSTDVFLTGGGANATPRVVVGYRRGAPGAQAIHVAIGDFYDVAAI